MRPLISVIIPVYNHAKTIRQSLLSLANQTYRPLEVIIINDGSTDDFLPLMDKIKNETPISSLHGKVISQNNQGAASARNRGFKEVTGQYVIFWDADTVADKRMLEKMLTVLLVHDSADFVYSRYRFGWKLMKSREYDFETLKNGNYIDTTSLMRRSVFSGFDPNLKRFQDWDLWLTVGKSGRKGIFLPETLFKKIVKGRSGMSHWLPSFFYRLPWKTNKVRRYEEAAEIIRRKHGFHS